jgi:hypothetical protein
MPECGIFARDLRTGRPVANAQAEWVVFSSAKCPWRDSITVEQYRRPTFDRDEVIYPQARVAFLTDVRSRERHRVEPGSQSRPEPNGTARSRLCNG